MPQTHGFNFTSEIITQSQITVGTSSVTVSSEKTLGSVRVELIYTNQSTSGQTIYLNLGQDAVANTGIVLLPNQAYTASQGYGFQVTQQRITAIASAASGTLTIFERQING